MQIGILNYAFDRALEAPEDLLDRFFGLVDWVEGLTSAGGNVQVFQRFSEDARLEIRGVTYQFFSDINSPRLHSWQVPRRMHRRIAEFYQESYARGEPCVVHINGLIFPLQTIALCRLLHSKIAVICQHHGEGPFTGVRAWIQTKALKQLDGFLFTSDEQADDFFKGLGISTPDTVFEVPEVSSRFDLAARHVSRQGTGMKGEPILLWTGNLNANKDPLTVLAGFRQILGTYPEARLYMAYREDELLEAVNATIGSDPKLRDSVTLLGSLKHAELQPFYNSADFFVQGSSREGGGFALQEALACGLMPVVTDIPAFRALLAGSGWDTLWQPGDPDALAMKLERAFKQRIVDQPQMVRDFFDRNLSIPVVGEKAVRAYRQILNTKWQIED